MSQRNVLFVIPDNLASKMIGVKDWIEAKAKGKLKIDIAFSLAEVTEPEKYQILAAFTFDWVAELLEKMTALEWLHILTAGVNKIWDWDLKDKNFLISKSVGVHAVPISEHVLALALFFSRKLAVFLTQQQQKVWQRHTGDELMGKTMGVIGLGNIGLAVCDRSRAFGMNILGYARTKRNIEGIDVYTGQEGLNYLLRESDFVVLAIPLTKDTNKMFGKNEFKQMKKSAYLINIARGQIVDEEALIDALTTNEIKGAGLDVFAEEPLQENSPLWKLKNVVITPHISGSSERYIERAGKIFWDNFQCYRDNKVLPTAVDKAKGY